MAIGFSQKYSQDLQLENLTQEQFLVIAIDTAKNGEPIYAARGRGGQHIIIIPDKNMVVVIIQEWNPFNKNESLENKLLGELLEIL